MLHIAIQIIVGTGDVNQFFPMIKYTESLYKIDAVALKQRCLSEASRITGSPVQHQSIYNHSLTLAREMLAAEKIEYAEAFAKVGKKSAAKSNNKSARSVAAKLVRNISETEPSSGIAAQPAVKRTPTRNKPWRQKLGISVAWSMLLDQPVVGNQ